MLLSLLWSNYSGPNTYNLSGTFYGGNLQIDWDTQLKQPLEKAGLPIYFVPSFNDKTGFNESASSTTISKRDAFSDLYSSYPAVDGMFNWDSSWPSEGASSNVSDAQDQGLMAAGKAVDKTYMMRSFPLPPNTDQPLTYNQPYPPSNSST